MRKPHQDRRIGRPRNGGEARIGLQPVDVELHRRQRPERQLGVGQHDLDHALDQIGLDRGVRPALDADRGLAAAAAEQHVDDRIDQVRIDRDEAEILPLLGLEHAEDGRQRNRIEIVAEPHRGDAVERHFDVVGGEIAQRRRHQPDQPVEDDLQHRQALVGDHRRIDDRADAGIVVERDVGERKAEQRVDFLLRENAFGAALGRLDEVAVVDHGRPLRGHRPRRSPVGAARGTASAARPRSARLRAPRPTRRRAHPGRSGPSPLSKPLCVSVRRHCTTISLNSTALIRLGAIAALTRRVSSSLSR